MRDLEIVENFFDDIDLIIDLAQKEKYFNCKDYNFETGHADTWPGERTFPLNYNETLYSLITHTFNKKFGYKFSKDAYFFHKRGEETNGKDWLHTDSCTCSLIVYLSKTNLKSGTIFCNKQNEIITDIGFVQNRALCFKGSILHSSKLNFGDDKNKRLTLNGFFHA